MINKYFSINKIFAFLLFQTILSTALINLYLNYSYFKEKNLIEKYTVFNQNEWIFNFNVTQYSSLVSIDKENNIIVESLIFYDHQKDLNYQKENTKCLLNVKENIIELSSYEVLNIALMGIQFYPKTFARIKCKLNIGNLTTTQIFTSKVAIIDSKYYSYFNERFNKSKNLITFQRPYYFNQSIPKKKQVVNCVHMVTNLEKNERLKKVSDWIDIMNKIKYAKIKLYLYNVDNTSKNVLNELQKKYSKGFIELINYDTSFEKLCQYSVRKLNETPDSKMYQFLYSNCQNSFDKHFRMSDLMVYNSHERMISNECLQSFRYEYEFVTNCDFDELIFPRIQDSESFNHTKLDNLTENRLLEAEELNKYQIYDYAKKLQNKYGTNIAYFQHDHVLLLRDFDCFIQKLSNFKFNTNITNNELIYENYGRFVKYTIQNDIYLKKLKKVIELVNYLNRTFYKNKYHRKWNNLYASKMNMRGKII